MSRDERFVTGTTFKLPCTVKYPYLTNPDTAFNKSVWSVTCVLDQEWTDKLKESGFKVRQDKDGDWVLKVTRKTQTQKGPQDPPKVVGPDAVTPFTEAVGNGSKCNVMIWARYTNPTDPNQPVGYLNALQVVEHVAFSGGGGDSFEPVEPVGDF